jgi:uncharacterized protein YqeY
MSMRDQLQIDLKDALKRGDKVRVSTIRLLNADLQNREIAKGKTLDDTDVVEAVQLATKKRREAIMFARQYGREEIACQEEQELAVLEAYLPTQLAPEAIMQRIDAVIQQLGVMSPKDFGHVMQALMPTVKGQADGNVVSRLVRERLQTLSQAS